MYELVKVCLKRMGIMIALTTTITAVVTAAIVWLFHLPITWLHVLVFWGVMTVALGAHLTWDYFNDWYYDDE